MKLTPQTLYDSLSQYILADGFDCVFDTERSHDSYMYDAKSEIEYLDLFSFFATQTVAFNHPKLCSEEFRTKLARIAVHRPTLSDIYTLEYGQFVETFARIAGRGYFKHYFFVEGGAVGVENALKAAFDWKVRKNVEKGRGEKGTQIIHFKDAFHGRTGYTLSLTNTADPNKYKYYPAFPWPRITNPKLRFPITDQVVAETSEAERKALDEMKTVLRKNEHDIAALIIEPIQSEGGDHHFRGEFLRALRTLADENEFLLIFDEVQTGMGLTGRMWSFEHFGVSPDLIAFGKKTQIAGCAATSRIDEVEQNVFREGSRINSTWGGNLVDMVRCTRILEIIESEHLLENVNQVGSYLLKQLVELSSQGQILGNVRGRGLQIAFDLPDTNTRNRFRQQMWKNRAIVLTCGERSIRLRPHLDFTRDEADHAIKIIKKTIEDLQ